MNSKHTPTPFLFGPLAFSVSGGGVFVGHDRVRTLVANMSLDELREANAVAWKARRAAARRCAKFANVSIHGDRPHDDAFLAYDVADAVRKITWAALAKAEGGAA